MKMLEIFIKITISRLYLCFNKKDHIYLFIILIFSACSSPRCPELVNFKGRGSTVNVSLFECGTSEKLFDLSFRLALEDRFSNNTDTKEYIYPVTENIQFKKYEDFDYNILIIRNSRLEFTVKAVLKEGDRVDIELINLEHHKPPENFSVSSSGGWQTSFRFYIFVEEPSEEGDQMEIAIVNPASNHGGLEVFNKNATYLNTKYSLAVSVSE